jgi:hypothetical protein
MKLALTLLTVITILGCSHESDSPTAPTSQVPPDTSASIWTVVTADDAVCALAVRQCRWSRVRPSAERDANGNAV